MDVMWDQFGGWTTALFVVLCCIAYRYRKRISIVATTLPRDLRFLSIFIRVRLAMKRAEGQNATVVGAVEHFASSTPDKTCFLFEDETWTFRDVNAFANKVARTFQEQGVVQGDVVALMATNSIEYVCLWLGVAKLGAVTALINHNLTGVSLAHTINATKAKVMLFGEKYISAVEEVRSDLPAVKKYFLFGQAGSPNAADWFSALQPLLDRQSTDNPEVDTVLRHHDHLIYIYTSGTTGLPKAAIITHAKVLYWPLGARYVCGVEAGRDVLYCSLPMYHGAGTYAASLALVHGVTVAFAPKFSASRFWSDCVRHGATCAQYIGELCRFLVLTAEGPYDRRHGVRALLGNGLSPAVWEHVQHRFGVDKVYEFYSATEGNVMLANLEGKVGAMGCMPRLLPESMWPLAVVQWDEEAGQPIRDDVTGLCVRCQDGESGMLLGLIRDDLVNSQFVGYLDKKASDSKVLRDVFVQTDRYFLTGDLVVKDELGYVYFKDRTGDTFRWKSENVSTAEVEAVMTTVLLPFGVREVAVYGVVVPGHEGRAGMAALADPDRRADMASLAGQLAGKLPSYARPVFVRIARALPMTGTHKVSKVVLQREGFNEIGNEDDVFVLNSKDCAYVPLSAAVLADIAANRWRL